MSEIKLQNYLARPRTPVPAHKIYTPVFLSDSKGYRLQSQVDHNHSIERQIVWWNQSRATIEDQYNWLKSNLAAQLIQLGNIHLLVWLGTCNLTTKTGNFIFITKRDDSEAENVIKYIDLIVNLIKTHHGSIVTILELPEYSITTHNRHKNHPNPDSCKHDDKLLHA